MTVWRWKAQRNATNSINGDRVQYWDFRVGVLGPSAKACFGSLVDGIHTYDFATRQFEILKPRMSRGGLIAFDDIDFARPGTRMHEAWTDIAATDEIVAAVEIQGRSGLVELGL
jgi:hypothetical protein